MNVADGQLLPKLLAAALCSTILLVVIDVRGLVGGGGVSAPGCAAHCTCCPLLFSLYPFLFLPL